MIGLEDAKKIVRMAIDNFQNRGNDVMIPKQKSPLVAGFSVESVEYHLGGTFRGSYYTLNDNIINGRIRGVAGVVGCTNPRVKQDWVHVELVKELIKNDVLVVQTGCSQIALAKAGLTSPEAAALAVRGAYVVAVGSDEEVAAYVGPETRIVELQGRLAIPLAAIRRMIERARPRPATPVYSELSGLLQVRLHEALSGQRDPAEALSLAAREMRELLARKQLGPDSAAADHAGR